MYKEKIEGNKNFTKLTHKGVSLIVLIVTIIVIIILASVIILTISKNNPIESAKEAQFKEHIRTFQYELNLYISKEYAVTGGKRDKKIDALDFEKIKEYIPSFSERYREKFVIQDDELRYTEKIVETEKEWLKELNIKEIEPLLPEVYTELEYIEKDGFTQFINTGLIPQPDWTYEFDFERIGRFSYLCGSDENYKEGSFNISIDLKTGEGLRTLNFGTWFSTSRITPPINKRMVITKKPNQFIIGTNTYNINIGNIKAEYPLVIFTTNRNGQPQTAEAWVQQYRLYRFSIKNANEELIMNLLPCLDKNGTPCMYDTVKRKFHYNEGTGEFIAGPEK